MDAFQNQEASIMFDGVDRKDSWISDHDGDNLENSDQGFGSLKSISGEIVNNNKDKNIRSVTSTSDNPTSYKNIKRSASILNVENSPDPRRRSSGISMSAEVRDLASKLSGKPTLKKMPTRGVQSLSLDSKNTDAERPNFKGDRKKSAYNLLRDQVVNIMEAQGESNKTSELLVKLKKDKDQKYAGVTTELIKVLDARFEKLEKNMMSTVNFMEKFDNFEDMVEDMENLLDEKPWEEIGEATISLANAVEELESEVEELSSKESDKEKTENLMDELRTYVTTVEAKLIRDMGTITKIQEDVENNNKENKECLNNMTIAMENFKVSQKSFLRELVDPEIDLIKQEVKNEGQILRDRINEIHDNTHSLKDSNLDVTAKHQRLAQLYHQSMKEIHDAFMELENRIKGNTEGLNSMNDEIGGIHKGMTYISHQVRLRSETTISAKCLACNKDQEFVSMLPSAEDVFAEKVKQARLVDIQNELSKASRKNLLEEVNMIAIKTGSPIPNGAKFRSRSSAFGNHMQDIDLMLQKWGSSPPKLRKPSPPKSDLSRLIRGDWKGPGIKKMSQFSAIDFKLGLNDLTGQNSLKHVGETCVLAAPRPTEEMALKKMSTSDSHFFRSMESHTYGTGPQINPFDVPYKSRNVPQINAVDVASAYQAKLVSENKMKPPSSRVRHVAKKSQADLQNDIVALIEDMGLDKAVEKEAE